MMCHCEEPCIQWSNEKQAYVCVCCNKPAPANWTPREPPPAVIVMADEDKCPRCHGIGCDFCNSWGCMS
jgi:hypothetical protein